MFRAWIAGRFADAADLIQRAEARLCAGPGVLPVDLTVRTARVIILPCHALNSVYMRK